MIEDYKNLLESFGWDEFHSNNPLMKSFFKDNLRLNFYFTTGTVTIQEPGCKIQSYKKVDLKELETIICSPQNM